MCDSEGSYAFVRIASRWKVPSNDYSYNNIQGHNCVASDVNVRGRECLGSGAEIHTVSDDSANAEGIVLRVPTTNRERLPPIIISSRTQRRRTSCREGKF